MLTLVLVTITATAGGALTDARDLGFLLHKHPERVQVFDAPTGRAHVLYPEVGEQRCTAALLLEVDPLALVRGRSPGGSDAFSLAQHVNDRPYVASSLLAVAMGRVFRTAMAGRCDSRPELAEAALDLELHVPALPCRGGAEVARALFAPLGWDVDARAVPLDPTVPAWGDADLVDLHLRGTVRLADALHHLYVLLPVLDDAKHYWVSPDEVDKLVRAGAGWLAAHPERDLITRRYLKHQRSLVTEAVARLLDGEEVEPEEDAAPARGLVARQRTEAVVAALREAGATSVVDLGCGEGRLLAVLLDDVRFARLLGVDVSAGELARAERHLALDRRGDSQRARVQLVQGSVLYRDARLAGFDAAVLMEVVEHVDPERLPALVATVFGAARPATVVLTTPNAEHNARYPGLAPGQLRHRDHRFEWTREQLRAWAQQVGDAHGYDAAHAGIGEDDPDLGPPTQLAVFTRRTA